MHHNAVLAAFVGSVILPGISIDSQSGPTHTTYTTAALTAVPTTTAARNCGIFPKRLRSPTIPNIGSNSIPNATGPWDPCEDPVFAADWVLVWMVTATFVAGLPAGMVAGEKVIVASGGSPVAVKVTSAGSVANPIGATVRLYDASAPCCTVWVGALPSSRLKKSPTVKTTVAVAVV